MSSGNAREYADPSGLRTRIETHARYSARQDDPIADVLSSPRTTPDEAICAPP